MNNFYFTFGSGTVLTNKYLKISAKNESDARRKMFSICGEYFCTSYNEDEFIGDNQPEKYQISECTVNDVIEYAKNRLYEDHIISKFGYG